MQWKKSPPELAAFLAEALASFDCQAKKMFGYPCYFVNGNMWAGLHQDSLFIRLSGPDQKELLSTWTEAGQLEPMPGHYMKDYVVLPETLYRDTSAFAEWLERSYRWVSSLPPKQSKSKKKG